MVQYAHFDKKNALPRLSPISSMREGGRGERELQLLMIHLPLYFHAYVGTQDIAHSKNTWDTYMATNNWLYKSSLG